MCSANLRFKSCSFKRIFKLLMQSTKANIAYSLLLTLGNYIFPLLTYPYVSRVLGVTNIGICNYVDSIVNYFVLFSTLGILSVGIREIARSQHNKQQLSIVFSSNVLLIFLNHVWRNFKKSHHIGGFILYSYSVVSFII